MELFFFLTSVISVRLQGKVRVEFVCMGVREQEGKKKTDRDWSELRCFSSHVKLEQCCVSEWLDARLSPRCGVPQSNHDAMVQLAYAC